MHTPLPLMAAERTSCAPAYEWTPPPLLYSPEWMRLLYRAYNSPLLRNGRKVERKMEVGVWNTGKKRGESAFSEAVETNGRYREPIRINREIWFWRECKAFFAGQRKRGEEILVRIGNLYPDSHPASRVRRIMKRGLELGWKKDWRWEAGTIETKSLITPGRDSFWTSRKNRMAVILLGRVRGLMRFRATEGEERRRFPPSFLSASSFVSLCLI